jgi:hypothetical protein
MPFRVIPLEQSWFQELDVDHPWIPTDRFPRIRPNDPIPWTCAVDEERRVLLTQLVSDTWEMREFLYFWLLAVHGDVVCIKEDMPRARMVGTPVIARHSYEKLIALANEARQVLCPSCGAFQFEPLTPAYPPQRANQEWLQLCKVAFDVMELAKRSEALKAARSAGS